GRPEVAPGVAVTARAKDVFCPDGGIAFVPLCNEGRRSERLLLSGGELNVREPGNLVPHLREGLHEAVSAVDHHELDVALVGDADVIDEPIGHYQTVGADQTEDACKEAVSAGAVVRVDEADLEVVPAEHRGCGLVAEPDHVLGEGALVRVARTALHDGVSPEAFTHESFENLPRGDVCVRVRAALVSLS